MTITFLGLIAALLLAQAARAEVAWSPPTEISARTATYPYQHVKVDGAGNATVALRTIIGGKTAIQVVEKRAGAAWGAPVTVSDPGEKSDRPSLAVNAAGEAVVAWNVGGKVRAATRPASGGWSGPVTIADGQPGDWTDAHVGIDAKGNAVAVWLDPNRQVQSSSRPAGGSWSAPTQISPGGQNVLYLEPVLAVDPDGTATVSWLRDEDATRTVEGTSKGFGDPAWQRPTTLNAPDVQPFKSSVAASSSGASVVWFIGRTAGNVDRIYAAVRLPSGGFEPTTAISDPSADPGEEDAAAFAANGSLTMVWAQPAGPGSAVVSARWSPTTFAWSAPVAISAPGNISRPAVAVDAQDNAVTIWGNYDQPSPRMQAATRSAQGAWGAPAFIGGGALGGSDPRIALTPQGTGAAVWALDDGLLSSVVGASLDTASGAGGGGAGGAGGGQAGPGAGGGRPGGQTPIGGQGVLPVASVVPTVSAVKMTNKRFRVASGRTALTARTPRGTAFVFTLKAPARVQIAITRTVTGARSRGRCVALTTKLRKAHAKRCKRAVVVGTLTRKSVPAGKARVAFTGRLGRRALAARTYRAVITARNSAGRSASRPITFTVVR